MGVAVGGIEPPSCAYLHCSCLLSYTASCYGRIIIKNHYIVTDCSGRTYRPAQLPN